MSWAVKENGPGLGHYTRAFVRHRQAFRAIAALEWYASLLCLVPFAPCFDNAARENLDYESLTHGEVLPWCPTVGGDVLYTRAFNARCLTIIGIRF